MTDKKEKKVAKKALKKTACIVLAVLAVIIAVIAVVFVVYAITWFKDGTNTTVAVILLILGAAGVIIDIKIAVKIKDTVFAAKMDKKFGDRRNAPAAAITPEETKGLSKEEIAYKICDAYRGESGGNGDADYRITSINCSMSGGDSVRFTVELEVTVNWDPGADRSVYLNKGRIYANEVESKIKREITSVANKNGLYGVSVTVSSRVN